MATLLINDSHIVESGTMRLRRAPAMTLAQVARISPRDNRLICNIRKWRVLTSYAYKYGLCRFIVIVDGQ